MAYSSASFSSPISSSSLPPPPLSHQRSPIDRTFLSFPQTQSQSQSQSRSKAIGRRNLTILSSALGGKNNKKKFKGTAMREEKLSVMIEKKVAEAMEACDGDDGKGSDGCKVAWDEVEEISQAKADLRIRIASDADPLKSFCEHNPHTDECKIYED